MKNINVKYYILGLISIFFSCANMNDEWIELGDEYVCKIDSHYKSIIPTNTYFDTHIYSKITDYKFDSIYIIAKQEPDFEYYKSCIESEYSTRFSIYENFLKEGKTKEFKKITTPHIRKAIITDSSFYKNLKSKGITSENQIADMDKIKIILDSVFTTDKFYKKIFTSKLNYWIINKDKNIRFGPFTKSEFENKCKEKRIKLKFNENE
jgi:hypothetical protein